MKKARLKNLNDFLALLVRHRWWVVIPAVALCGLSILVSLVLPKMYVSQTMIILQPRDVPDDIVKNLIPGDSDERMTAIEQTILSRTNLLKILSEFENRLTEYQSFNDEKKVAKIKNRIKLEISSNPRRTQNPTTTNIRISYRDRNPDLAQRITARLASFFIEQDNRVRENTVFGTAEFLESELNKVTEQLQQSGSKLKALKERYRYELPSELETNLRTLDRLQLQKNGNLEALDRIITLQMNIKRQITETPAKIARESAVIPSGTAVVARNPKVDLYRRIEREYKDLILKAKETHPDVRRLKAQLDQLKQEIPPEDFAEPEKKESPVPAPPEMVNNPVYQSLIDQLNQLNTDIGIREKEKKWIEEEMAKYNRRIQNTPRIEQEMLEITRLNADLTKQHEELQAKLQQARLAGSLESRQKGSQFEVVDPANYPMEPSPPSRSTILLIGLGVSLAAGIASALAVNALNQKVWTHHELERALEAPVLVEIPSIATPVDIRQRVRRMVGHAFLFIACSGFYLGGLYYLYLKHSVVLRYLDPLIEKIAERSAG